MTLTVCGSSGSLPSRNRACSSYLLRGDDGAQLVLDLGNGSLSNLLRWVPADSLTDLVISHGHHDHFADLIGLLHLATYGSTGPAGLRIYANAATCERLHAFQEEHAAQADMVTFVEVAAGQRLVAGGFTVDVFEAWHSRPGIMTRVTDRDGAVLAYTGDSDLTDEVVVASQDADLLVAEATWLAGAGEFPVGVHMTGSQAGELARRAQVARLLVTHVWPEFDPAEVAAQAAEVFDGPTVVADDGLILAVGDY